MPQKGIEDSNDNRRFPLINDGRLNALSAQSIKINDHQVHLSAASHRNEVAILAALLPLNRSLSVIYASFSIHSFCPICNQTIQTSGNAFIHNLKKNSKLKHQQ
jgi:hypothetical protein